MSIRNWLHRVVGNDTELVVENTGQAVADDLSDTVTGYDGPPLRQGQKVVVRNTGNAVATGGGTAVSGISYTDKKEKN